MIRRIRPLRLAWNAAVVVSALLGVATAGCSSQHAGPRSAAPIPPIQLHVIDADSGKPLEHVIVVHYSEDVRGRHTGLTDANGEFQLGANLVGDKVWLLFPDCDPDGTVQPYKRLLLLGAAAAVYAKDRRPDDVNTTIPAIPYGNDYRVVASLKRDRPNRPDPIGQQWISEITYLKRRMTKTEAFALLKTHGIHEPQTEGNAGYSRIGCCWPIGFVSDRYPGRTLQLQFRELPPQAPGEPPRASEDQELLNFWLVQNEATETATTDPAVWKAAEHRMY